MNGRRCVRAGMSSTHALTSRQASSVACGENIVFDRGSLLDLDHIRALARVDIEAIARA
jgi:hypothetical protein